MPIFGPPDISKLKARRDVKGLLAALSYKKDAEIRRQAAIALAELLETMPPDSKSALTQPLVAALDDSDYPVTVAVVQASDSHRPSGYSVINFVITRSSRTCA